MNEALTVLSNGCYENALAINTEKTFFILSHKQPRLRLKISKNPFVQTQDAKYLGVYLDGKLTWRSHVEKTVEKTYKT
jgi:hypothetical protein